LTSTLKSPVAIHRMLAIVMIWLATVTSAAAYGRADTGIAAFKQAEQPVALGLILRLAAGEDSNDASDWSQGSSGNKAALIQAPPCLPHSRYGAAGIKLTSRQPLLAYPVREGQSRAPPAT
jgi:hypothetical protein